MIPELRTLLEMLTYCRPDGSPTEREFIARWIMPLGATQDVDHNWHLVIPLADGSPSTVVWSCHTDTVAWKDGRQTVHYNHRTGIVELSRKSRAVRNCLGADDTAGVFLCTQMALARVPGHYIFHYGEECGGIGSSALAGYNPEMLAGISYAIALDRRGDSDIITHQWGGRCASEAFADSLALELFRCSAEQLVYNSTHGTYTDTAEYTGIVPECTNLSVGYANEHRDSEALDTVHTLRLLSALLRFDEARLVCERPVDNVTDRFNWDNYLPSHYRDVDSPPLLDDDGRPLTWDDDPIAVDCYLDRVQRDVQQALTRRNCPTCGRDTFAGFEHQCAAYKPLYPRMVC